MFTITVLAAYEMELFCWDLKMGDRIRSIPSQINPKFKIGNKGKETTITNTFNYFYILSTSYVF